MRIEMRVVWVILTIIRSTSIIEYFFFEFYFEIIFLIWGLPGVILEAHFNILEVPNALRTTFGTQNAFLGRYSVQDGSL